MLYGILDYIRSLGFLIIYRNEVTKRSAIFVFITIPSEVSPINLKLPSFPFADATEKMLSKAEVNKER